MRRAIRAAGALFAATLLASCTGLMRPAGLVAPDAKWEEVSHAGRVYAEGVVAAKDGAVYVSDLTRTGLVREGNPRGTIYRYDPATGTTTRYLEPSGMANGLHVDRGGDLIMAQDADGGGRAVVRRNLATGQTSLVANAYRGKRLNSPNDVTSDAQGRIYFTDARYGEPEPAELPNAVYRSDHDGGRLVQLSTDILRPNGIEVSPDGKRLYVSASNTARLPPNPNGPAQDRFGITMGGVVVYDLDADGNLTNGRVFYKRDDLVADGMAMDSDGDLYVAFHNANPRDPKGAIVALDPGGALLAELPLPPGALPTNLGFGRGADAGSLYMTSAVPWKLYRLKTLRHGHYFEQ
ncbi:MAG TPA: SMP-30/gluconolactonase/LRE family protein [Burkholderiales bacterium]